MKPSTLFCAGACILMLAGGAAAKDGVMNGTHAKAHRTVHHKSVHAARRPAQPAAQKDPYAAYWDDPGRQAPPFSYFGER